MASLNPLLIKSSVLRKKCHGLNAKNVQLQSQERLYQHLCQKVSVTKKTQYSTDETCSDWPVPSCVAALLTVLLPPFWSHMLLSHCDFFWRGRGHAVQCIFCCCVVSLIVFWSFPKTLAAVKSLFALGDVFLMTMKMLVYIFWGFNMFQMLLQKQLFLNTV